MSARGSTPSGDLVRRIMRKRRISTDRLAEILEVHPRTIRRYLSGDTSPDFFRLQDLMSLAPDAPCPCCERRPEEVA